MTMVSAGNVLTLAINRSEVKFASKRFTGEMLVRLALKGARTASSPTESLAEKVMGLVALIKGKATHRRLLASSTVQVNVTASPGQAKRPVPRVELNTAPSVTKHIYHIIVLNMDWTSQLAYFLAQRRESCAAHTESMHEDDYVNKYMYDIYVVK